MPWMGHFLQTLIVHCFRFILLIVTCFFTTILVDFLNIKHFSSSEDVKCVCEYCTLIKRQVCDIDF